jgi:DNA-binding HxlR family transcriptional regulator
MRGYGQFCPIAVGAEIFAERWTPLIVRELFAGSTRFNQLQRGLPRIPKAILARRLRFLEQVGVVEHRVDADGGTGYHLTAAGHDLATVAVALGAWAKEWGYADIQDRLLDPDFLLWDMHRGIVVERLPERRVVVRVDLVGARERSYWLVMERPEPSLCLVDPGMEVDLLMTADTVALHRVWVGELDLAKALTTGAITLEGAPELRRAFPGWLALGFYARQPATT